MRPIVTLSASQDQEALQHTLDLDLADEIRLCELNMTGGNPTCPIGRAILEKSVRSRRLLRSYLAQRQPVIVEPSAPARPQGGDFHHWYRDERR